MKMCMCDKKKLINKQTHIVVFYVVSDICYCVIFAKNEADL